MHHSSSRGNALFIILIGVILFAALSFAITQSHESTSNLSLQEENSLAADEIIQYGNGLRGVIDRMVLLGGVSESALRFSAQDANATYGVVGASPAAEVFNYSGGGATYQTPPASTCLSSPCTYEYSGQYTIADVGSSTKAELVMLVINIDGGTCQKINQTLNTGFITPPTGGALSLTRFTGAYGDTGAASPISFDSNGKRAFCYREAGGQQRFIYVSVIHPR